MRFTFRHRAPASGWICVGGRIDARDAFRAIVAMYVSFRHSESWQFYGVSCCYSCSWRLLHFNSNPNKANRTSLSDLNAYNTQARGERDLGFDKPLLSLASALNNRLHFWL